MSMHQRLERLARDHRLRLSSDPCTRPLPPPCCLKSVRDVLTLLEQHVDTVHRDDEASTVEKARTIGYLASIALRAIETGNLAARIEMLEMVLKQRKGDAKP